MQSESHHLGLQMLPRQQSLAARQSKLREVCRCVPHPQPQPRPGASLPLSGSFQRSGLLRPHTASHSSSCWRVYSLLNLNFVPCCYYPFLRTSDETNPLSLPRYLDWRRQPSGYTSIDRSGRRHTSFERQSDTHRHTRGGHGGCAAAPCNRGGGWDDRHGLPES